MLIFILIIACAFISSCRENGESSSDVFPDTVAVKIKIPENTFYVPGSNGGTYVFVKSLHPHNNNAYLVFFHPTTGVAVDSGRFFAVCPLDKLSFIPNPREQFVKFEQDTLWYRGQNGESVCWMQKEK
jgi:hypothetical protein